MWPNGSRVITTPVRRSSGGLRRARKSVTTSLRRTGYRATSRPGVHQVLSNTPKTSPDKEIGGVCHSSKTVANGLNHWVTRSQTAHKCPHVLEVMKLTFDSMHPPLGARNMC